MSETAIDNRKQLIHSKLAKAFNYSINIGLSLTGNKEPLFNNHLHTNVDATNKIVNQLLEMRLIYATAYFETNNPEEKNDLMELFDRVNTELKMVIGL